MTWEKEVETSLTCILSHDVNWLLCTLFQEVIYHPRQHRILVQVDQMWYSLNLFLFFTLLSSWRITLRHLDLLRTMKYKSFWVRYRVLEKGLWTTEGPLKVVWGHLGMRFVIRSLKQVIKKIFYLAYICDLGKWKWYPWSAICFFSTCELCQRYPCM